MLGLKVCHVMAILPTLYSDHISPSPHPTGWLSTQLMAVDYLPPLVWTCYSQPDLEALYNMHVELPSDCKSACVCACVCVWAWVHGCVPVCVRACVFRAIGWLSDVSISSTPLQILIHIRYCLFLTFRTLSESIHTCGKLLH